MKKNKMMRIASVLLVAVLLSTCVIGGTFAKYTSDYTGNATAQVAKWAFELNGAAAANDFEVNLIETAVEEIGGGADAEVKDGFIAPGSQGSFQIVLENTSDVAATYTVVVQENSDYPITFDIDVPTADIAIGGTATITVTWEWEFGASVDDTDVAGQEFSTVVSVNIVQKD